MNARVIFQIHGFGERRRALIAFVIFLARVELFVGPQTRVSRELASTDVTVEWFLVPKMNGHELPVGKQCRAHVADLLTQSGERLGSLAERDAELGDAFARAAVTVAGASSGPEFVESFVVSGSVRCEQSLSWFVLRFQAATLKNSRRSSLS